jgi:ribosomal protein L11 methylase PrmA
MTEPYEPASFRDRDARIFQADGRIFRALSPQGLEDWTRLSASRFFQTFSQRGSIVGTRRADDEAQRLAALGDGWAAALVHDRIPFISYPYEWSFSMLKDAALLHLDLILAALAEGQILKDATAYNVQFVGARPVFIDVASFEKLPAGEPWHGYRQFCQLFLYPLLLQAYKDAAFQPWLRGSLEGIDPRDMNALMSARDLLRAGVLAHVKLQAGAQERFGATSRNVRADLKSAGFSAGLIKANVSRLRKLIAGLEWKRTSSTWAGYADANSYAAEDADRKARFVGTAAASSRRGLVWDLGGNTGRFSRIAAEHADHVVTVDADPLAIERLYRELRKDGPANILPIIGNVADPSPGLGWRGLERLPLARRGKPDLILALALIHHVVITANVPPAEFEAWMAGLGGELVTQFATKQDEMVKTLLRNKDDQYADYDQAYFESRLDQHYRIAARETIQSGSRTLYHAIPRP